jgi:hypothetical protein
MPKFLVFHGPVALRRNLYFQNKLRRTTGTGTTSGISEDTREIALTMS